MWLQARARPWDAGLPPTRAGSFDALAPLMAQAAQWRLLCVGDGPQLEQWKVAAEKSGLGKRCHFVPWTAHIARFYSAMDVLVAPSVAPETFCRAVAEAQACHGLLRLDPPLTGPCSSRSHVALPMRQQPIAMPALQIRDRQRTAK